MVTKEELLLELEKRPVPQELLDAKEKAIQEYNEFFEITLQKQFKIYMIHSREEMDIAAERKTENWLAGYSFGQKGQIFLFDSDCYIKETGKTIYNTEKLIKHEIAHLYFGEITKTNKPKWLNEGLAEHLAQKKKSDKSLEEIVDCIDCFDDFLFEHYRTSSKLIELLITKYGKEKLLALLESLKNKEKFFSAFQNIYGFEITKENLIENLKD
jgi:hypothetical protein